jgi:iron complex transport system ATP-binding protein
MVGSNIKILNISVTGENMTETNPVIKIEHADVYLDGAHILKDINWQVEPGENYFILGANGAGKTTLVKLLMGYVWARFGAHVEVLNGVFGRTNLVQLRKRIAWLSPFLARWTGENTTVLEVVISGLDAAIGLHRPALPEEVDKAHEMLRQLNCEDITDRPFVKTSSGEQLKALICRALIGKPELLILDEPCVHLDMRSREYLLKTIEELLQRPDAPTMVFITQRIEDVTPIFSRGMIMRKGQIIAKGSRDEILTEENICDTFGMNIKLHHSENGRIWPQLV